MNNTSAERLANTPDSLVSFGHKRLDRIRDAAETKFSESLVKINVNRPESRFDIIVTDNVPEADMRSFEVKWTMCKVIPVKFIPRKK